MCLQEEMRHREPIQLEKPYFQSTESAKKEDELIQILATRCLDSDFGKIDSQKLSKNQINNGNNQLFVALESSGKYRDKRWSLTLHESQIFREIDCIPWKSNVHTYCMINSCNGLLLAGQYGRDGSDEGLRFWNPCIRKSLLLPTCPLPFFLFRTRYLLGFAPRSKDYKVVAFTYENFRGIRPRKIHFAVFGLRDQLWAVNTDTTSKFELDSLSVAVFFRGAAYWLVVEDSDEQRCGLVTHLGSFDYDKEEITLLHLPISLDKTSSLSFLFLLGESLALFSISLVMSNIWVLEQDNKKGSWILWFSGKSSEDGYEAFESVHSTLGNVFYCESDAGYFICRNKTYNLASCQVQEFNKFTGFVQQLERYSESLVLSKGYGAHDLRVLQ